MTISKNDLSNSMMKWLDGYLQKKYSEPYDVEVLIPDQILSKISKIRNTDIPNRTLFDFKPDVLGILTDKNNGSKELVLLNRGVKSTSLKEIGEILCYCRISNPVEAFLCSTKGLPTEVTLLLLDDDTQKRLLNFGDDRHITIFRWDYVNRQIDKKLVFPKSERSKL